MIDKLLIRMIEWLDEKIVTSRYYKLYEKVEDVFYLIFGNYS